MSDHRSPPTVQRSPRLRSMLFRAAAVAGGFVVALLLVEGSLRLFPQLFSREVMHWAFSRYDTLPGGLYVGEKKTRMRFMRSDFSTRTYSHGYWWTHRTDELGFRNPPELEDRRILLLGDSLIYGHGVEEEHTVAHNLRSEHGVPAYNMAMPGKGLYEHYVLLRLYLDELEPQHVVLFVFLNDLRDLEKHRREKEIANAPELRRGDYPEILRRIEVLQKQRPPLLTRAAYELGSVRLASKWLDSQTRRSRYRASMRAKATADGQPAAPLPRAAKRADRTASRPPPTLDEMIAFLRRSPGRVEAAVLLPERFRPLARYYNRIMADMSERCTARGARLVVVHLFLPEKDEHGPAYMRAQRKLLGMLRKIADRQGIEVYDTEALYRGTRETCFLPHDGHFNRVGHRRLARFLTDEVLQER